MRRLIGILSLIVFLVPALVGAVATPPAETLWVTPSDARPGATIDLNAFVYNNTKNEVSVTVMFASGGTDIGTVVVVVPKESGKSAVVPWVMPEAPASILVSITKAVNTKDKKDVASLKGELGTIAVGATAPIAINGFPGADAIKQWFGIHLASVEKWRIAQAEHFATMRDEAKRDLGISVARQVEEKIAKEIAGVEPEKNPSADSQNNPKDYLILIGATSLASLLGSMLMFYVVGIVLAFIVLRFIIRRFI